MPIAWNFDTDRDRLNITVHGEFTLEELMSSVASIMEDANFKPGMDILGDHLQAAFAARPAHLAALVRYMRRHRARLRGCHWAIATRNPMAFAMIRMGAWFAKDGGAFVKPFTSLPAAEAWLERQSQDRDPPPGISMGGLG